MPEEIFMSDGDTGFSLESIMIDERPQIEPEQRLHPELKLDRVGGNPEEIHKENMDEMLRRFKADAKVESKRFETLVDAQYFFCLCFESRDQVAAFLEKTGWSDLLDDQYIDGVAVAMRMGIELKPAPFAPKLRKTEKRTSAMAEPLPTRKD